MEKLETENELNLKITDKTKNELVNEDCCTILTISLNNNGDVYTTFLGAYNKEVLKLLEKSQKIYYKGLMKKLKDKTIQDMTSEKVDLEQNKPAKKQHEIKKKVKSNDENSTTQAYNNESNVKNKNIDKSITKTKSKNTISETTHNDEKIGSKEKIKKENVLKNK